MEWFFDHILCHATPPPFLDRFPRFWYQQTALDNDQVTRAIFRISTSGQISSGSFIARNKYFEGCIFSKYFFWRKIFWEIAILKWKKSNISIKKSQLFKDVDFAWIETWKDGCLCWYDVILLHRIAVVIKNLWTNLWILPFTFTKLLRFKFTEKGHQVCKQVRGYVSLLKTVVTLKESRALPFPSSREIRHSCNGQTRG